jgi:hypothetical protein
MAGWRLLAALAAVALVVAGCGMARVPGAGPAAPSAPGSAAGTVSAGVARNVPCRTPRHDPVGVSLPAGFTPVAAIRCIETDQKVPGHGLWEFTLKQVAGRGLARLAAALRRPSVIPPPNLMCAVPGLAVPPFVLLGRDGRVISPKLPVGECGNPQRQVLTAVRKLRWVTVSARRDIQVETQAGIRSGCPSGWKDMIGFLDSTVRSGGSMHASAGGPVFASRPPSLRVCVYRDRSGPLDTYLVGGDRVSGTAETKVLQGITGGRSSAGCHRPHAMFVLLQPAGVAGSLVAYVEIGGCQRVLRPDNRIGQASPAALAIINQVGRG